MVRLHRPTVSSLARHTPRRLSPWQRPTPERSYPASLSFSHPLLTLLRLLHTYVHPLYLCALFALTSPEAWLASPLSSSFSRARTKFLCALLSLFYSSLSLFNVSPRRCNLQHTDIARLSREFPPYLLHDVPPSRPFAFARYSHSNVFTRGPRN